MSKPKGLKWYHQLEQCCLSVSALCCRDVTHALLYSPGRWAGQLLGCRCCLFTPLPQGIPFVFFGPTVVKEQLDLCHFHSFLFPSLVHYHHEQLQFCQVFPQWVVGIFPFHQHLNGFPSFLSILRIYPFSCLDRMNLFSFLAVFPKDVFQWNADLFLKSSNGGTGFGWEVTGP